jgi:SAM-dependent methyltransferase
MNCLSHTFHFISQALEHLGLYEPEIDAQEAHSRLYAESKIWKGFQGDRDELWGDFQASSQTSGPLHHLVAKAVTTLESDRHSQRGVAVDLGCGISTTTFNLLEKGWKVYAIDSSKSVLETLAKTASSLNESWIEDGQLVLVHDSIEGFEYPEKVHLITAIDSLPYCNPKKVTEVFLRAKDALVPQGIFVCTLFSHDDPPMAKNMLRAMFGAWMTTKNVVDATIKSINFASWSVEKGTSPGGMGKQVHVIAQVG